jgi:hypothetical protein
MINFNDILSVTHAAIVKGDDIDTAARAAYPLLAKGDTTLIDLLRKDTEHGILKQSVSAAYKTMIGGMRAWVIEQGVDHTDAKKVRWAIRGAVWEVEGYATELTNPVAPTEEALAAMKTKKERDAAVALFELQSADYKRIHVRVGRLVKAIVDAPKKAKAPAQQVAATPVKRVNQSAINALRDAGASKDELLAAIERAFA